MSVKKRIFLRFPQEKIEKPFTYHLVKDYDLIVNIFKAKVTSEEGKLGIEIEGEKKNIDSALAFLKAQGIKVTGFEKEIEFRKEKCENCGVCISVCPSKAITLDRKDFSVNFDKEKCIACEACVEACPFRAIAVND